MVREIEPGQVPHFLLFQFFTEAGETCASAICFTHSTEPIITKDFLHQLHSTSLDHSKGKNTCKIDR